MNTETLEKASKLWGELRALRFQHGSVVGATRFSFYVKEQVNMLSLPAEAARDILRDLLQQEIERVTAELTALGVDVAA